MADYRKKMVLGPGLPGDCPETQISAENIPYHVARIAERYNVHIDPLDVTTPDGISLGSHNLEQGLAISGVPTHRRDIRRDIKSEIGLLNVEFV
jgi:hypothetical protein